MIQSIMMACTFIVCGFIINGLSYLAGSNYLCSFLNGNLLLVLIALFAINTTTVSVILTKMREIADKHPDVDFLNTRKGIKKATIEQLVLIILTVIFQIAKTSPWLINKLYYVEFIFDSLLVAIFAYAIQILFDTARGVYVILDYGH